MHLIEIPERNIKVYIPEHLGECDNDQFAHICLLMFQYQSKELTLDQFKYNAVYKLMGLTKVKNSKLSKFDQEQMHANIYTVSCLLDSFLTKNEEDQIYIRQEFRKNPMPSIPMLNGSLKGPKDNFETMPFGQYLDALDIFGNFAKQPKTELLYKLCATLYQRSNYDPDKVPELVKQLKTHFFGYVYGAYILFTTFQHVINNSLIMIEGNLCDLSILYTKSSSQKKYLNLPNLGMKSTAFVLAESGVFGTYQEVRKADLWDILSRLYDMRVRDLEEEERMKQTKSKSKK